MREWLRRWVIRLTNDCNCDSCRGKVPTTIGVQRIGTKVALIWHTPLTGGTRQMMPVNDAIEISLLIRDTAREAEEIVQASEDN